ncbi:aminoglycoside phosphotransferase family protein [Georgenia sp. Z1491]|uniref:aminoglycoside phosphotransferase family protein n=1 Tax=Georgenia sp. Z1491 TaxID=3416707 RepID=UPI003CF19D93
MVDIPPGLTATVTGRAPDPALGTDGVHGDRWLAGLPRLVAGAGARWGLTADGPAMHGENALVVPVVAPSGRAVLKVTWPHEEARHEHLALRLWGGQAAVRLLAADPSAQVLLLERLDDRRPLTAEPVLDACEVVGRLLRALDRPAHPRLATVAARADRWRETLLAGSALVPHRLAVQARAELDDLLADAPEPRMVHEDLHDANVLAPLDAARGAWLAIDPKPVAAEPAFGVAPIVWNRAEETARAWSPRTHVRLRADVVADAAGLDPDRVRAWTHVRLVLNALEAARHAPASDDFRERMITLAKAFAD